MINLTILAPDICNAKSMLTRVVAAHTELHRPEPRPWRRMEVTALTRIKIPPAVMERGGGDAEGGAELVKTTKHSGAAPCA